ncbi:MAG: hypothetical protein U0Y68_18785 [Blastocatellia bacterium]
MRQRSRSKATWRFTAVSLSGQNSLSQRDLNPATNDTVLSGDLNNNDGPDFFDHIEDNCYHVVTGSGTDNTAILDGFTITRGWAYNLSGGGNLNVTGSPTLTNLIISGNIAVFFGAGIENQEDSNPTLTNVIISGNAVSGLGGGMANFSSNPALTNVIISGNSGIFGDNKGGGLANIGSSPTLTNVTITGNTAASGQGGGIFNSFRSSPNNPQQHCVGQQRWRDRQRTQQSQRVLQHRPGGIHWHRKSQHRSLFRHARACGPQHRGRSAPAIISNAINGGNKLVTKSGVARY